MGAYYLYKTKCIENIFSVCFLGNGIIFMGYSVNKKRYTNGLFREVCHCLFVISLFLLSGCTKHSTSEPENTSNPLNVTACDSALLDSSSLSCRLMHVNNKVKIAKLHGIAGNDEVKIVNTETHDKLVIPDCKLNGWSVGVNEAVIICYLHESNIASGRMLSASEKLNFILVETNTMQLMTNFELPFTGGIDPELIRVESDLQHIFCDKTVCIKIDSSLPEPHYEIVAENDNGKILEVVEVSENELGILSREDGEFILSRVRGGSEVARDKVEKGYNLAYKDGNLSLTPILDRDDIIDAFVFDYARLDRNSGLVWGETNSEGRLAWGAFYYWNSLAYVASVTNDKRLFTQIKNRISQELKYAFSEKISVENWIQSKRYSLNRTPTMFMMHTGRMISALNLIQKKVGYDTAPIVDKLEDFLSYGDFNEQFFGDRSLSDPVFWNNEELEAGWFYFRKGIDFWPDGLPVPFNFISAICTETHKYYVLEQQCREAINYLELEVLNANGLKWRYWPGTLANNGYTEFDNISINTPSWGGNVNRIAHDSYLSMDAIALLKRSASPELTDLIASMVATGDLQVDIAPFLDDVKLAELCNSSFVESVLNEEYEGDYGGYDFYLRASQIAVSDRCRVLNN